MAIIDILTVDSQIALATKTGVERLNRQTDEQEFRKIIEWISPSDHAAQHCDFLARREQGTGKWLLESEKFKNWRDTPGSHLYCPGIPGSGKTILTSIVIDSLLSKFKKDATVGIAYVYCNFRRKQEQGAKELLSAMLRQLVQGMSSIPDPIVQVYKQSSAKSVQPELSEISRLLHSTILLYSRTFFLVDALDECEGSGQFRNTFIAELKKIQTNAMTNLYLTSRFIPEIEKEFKECHVIEIRANEEDLQRYLVGHMGQLPSFVGRNPSLQEEIKKAILQTTQGM